MKRYMYSYVLSSFLLGTILTSLAGMATAADVACGRGVAEPPFLSYGASSNLLMLLDNSGSMLDMAYINPATQCFDQSYVPTDLTTTPLTIYAGPFPVFVEDPSTSAKTELWYKWVDVQPFWEPKVYNVGDRVYEDGVIFEAASVEVDSAGANIASTGANIYDDDAVEWIQVTRPIWKAGKAYHPGSFVYNSLDGHLYLTSAGGTSAGTDLGSDTGVTDWQVVPTWKQNQAYTAGAYVQWEDVTYKTVAGGTSSGTKTQPRDDDMVLWEEFDPFGWQAGTDYNSGDIVTFKGMIFEAKAGYAKNGSATTIYEDNFTTNWLRIDEGYFEEVTAAAAQAVCDTAAVGAGNTKYTASGLCVTLHTAAGMPTRTTAFAASGNMLNWIMASKFDIQKSILTGGKYNAGAQRVISENRGCSGSRFIKQVTLNTGDLLTLAIRGPKNDGRPLSRDRIDISDDTTRIEILAIGAGYNPAACQAAVDKILTHGLNGAQNLIDTCLAGTGTSADARSALNHAMQYCWQSNPNLKTNIDDCKKVYNGLPPRDIANWSNAYNCYGIFDDGRQHDVDRTGYVGRCWAQGTSAAGTTCDPQPKDMSRCGGAQPCEYWIGGTLLKNDATKTYTQYCYSLNNKGTACKNATKWAIYNTDSGSGLQCDPTDAIYTSGGGGSGADWSSDIDGVSGVGAGDTALVPAWVSGANNAGVSDEAYYCAYKAMEDYCSDISAPEVIDPTDQATSTSGDFGNIPGLLIDSGVLSNLGIDVPMNVMKGSIKRLSRPQGILQKTAGDLRLGAMAFNSVGAATECKAGSTTTLIEKYCPTTNKDGAQIISPVMLGNQMTMDLDGDGVFDIGEDIDRDGHFDNVNEDTNSNGVLDPGEDLDGDGKLDRGEVDLNGNGIFDGAEVDYDGDGVFDTTEDLNGDGIFLASDGLHADDIVEAINDVRATAWTPLAEAVYNAIGYYTQNPKMRLNEGDFQTDSDVMTPWQQDHYYAEGSYIMDGGTLYQAANSGTSHDPDSSDGLNLAGDKEVSWTAVGNFNATGWVDGNSYAADDIITYGGKLYHTVLGGTASLKDQAVTYGKSGPLFDAGVIWEFLVDPVINHCQGNYILIISEGASTADINEKVEKFALGTTGDSDLNTTPIIDTNESAADAAVASQCSDGLKGSTYVDDLAYFANDKDNLFGIYPDGSGTLPDNSTLPESDAPFDDKPKNNITTYIVTAGAPRDDGTANECNPKVLMDKAALNGGTKTAMSGADPQTLQDNLIAVFNELRQRASAGSAASVISSARGGEGAIYQAIFWPELKEGTTTVEWAGDVHALFLDAHGYMYEDTNGDRKLNPSEDLDKDGKLDVGEDANFNGVLDSGEDVDLDGVLDRSEDLDQDGHFDIGEDRNQNGVLDPGEDLDGDSTLDQTEDLNGNGSFDYGEDVNHNCVLDAGEDTNNNGILDTEDLDCDGHFDKFNEDLDNDHHFDRYDEDVDQDGSIDGDDYRVIIFFDKTPGIEKSRACWNTSILDTLGEKCSNATDMDLIHFLWSANQWLSEYPAFPAVASDLTIETNRSSAAGSFNAASRKRYIFTWNDVNKDGIVDSAEVVDFVAHTDGGPDWGPVAGDFDMADGIEVDKYIRWWRGQDFLTNEDTNDNGVIDGAEVDINGNGRADKALRSRQFFLRDPDIPASSYQITWRLGDVIHSTPMTVAAPAEGYHLIYNDFSYAQFVARWKKRRHMVYFGANDGMLHAVNAGFYNEANNKFYLGYDYSNKTLNDTGPALGTEMWAYVPYNLHPHLKCLANPLYNHKYFVDQRPRIFDAQIFEEEGECSSSGYDAEGCIHPNGWGTILVGGLGLGGTPVTAAELPNPVAGDTRQFISSYFILDITNPEAPPALLAELTRKTDQPTVDLGYSTVIPTMVIMKKGTTNKWYLMLGSGPHGDQGVKGMSDQGAKISVLPLDWIVDTTAAPGTTAARIPAVQPTAANPGGTFLAPAAKVQSFTSDLITVDFDINPSYEEYKADAVYFGTVEGETDTFGNSGFSFYSDGSKFWNGGGHMYRLVMEPSGHMVGKKSGDPITEPYQWEVKTLLNLGSETTAPSATYPYGIKPQIAGHPIQPITSAASVGTDGYNFWIYFGTGRFFDPDDKTDRQQQSYYGIKEPMIIDTDIIDPGPPIVTNRKRKLTWDEVELSGNPSSDPGSKGLVKVDEILVGESTKITTAPLACRDNTDPDGGPVGNYDCLELNATLPFYAASDNNAFFDKLEKYIAGEGSCLSNVCSELRSCTSSGGYADSNYKNNCSDGWRKDFWPYNNREKNVGQATLLGGLTTFTTYQPNSGLCQAEGSAYLYGVYYKTGTSWFENIFGAYGINSHGKVKNKLSLGRGLAATPNLHVGSGGKDGEGPKAFVQTSTGEIKEIKQENLPVKDYRTGRSKWKEYFRP